MQRGDGLLGFLIVRVPDDVNPIANLYDYDLTSHAIIYQDWTHTLGVDKYTDAIHTKLGNHKPDSILVNGLGRSKIFENENKDASYTPVARFVVEKVTKL